MRYFLYTLLFLFLFPLVALGQTSPTHDQNYVRQISYQTELNEAQVVAINAANSPSNNDKKIENIVYYDGLGRPKQSISIRAGGNREDLVTPILYDPLGRQPKDYLPLPVANNFGAFNNNTTINQEAGVISQIENYYQSKFPDDLPQGLLPGAQLNPYSEKRFERSPLNRVFEQAAPGYDWKLLATSDTDHTIKFDYQTNSPQDYVIRFTVAFTNNNTSQPTLVDQQGYYPANQLYKTVTKDENWQPGQANVNNHTTEEFKDKLGRVVLKRTFNDGLLDTYYVYDDFGNLTYVIPPKVDKTNNDVSPTELDQLCYQYKYDYRNRLVWKKIPGKGHETIFYNNLDQPILTQDANMRNETANKYLFTKYDALGRVAYTGFYTATIGQQSIQDSLQFNLEVNRTNYEIQKTTAQGATQIGDTQVFYSNSSYPSNNLEVLTINYYDRYIDYGVGGSNGLVLPTSVYDQHTTENTLVTTTTQGLPTVSRVRVLGQTPVKWITSLTAYDSRGRAIYSDSYNEYLDSRDIHRSKLDVLTGRPEETYTFHNKDNEPSIVILDYFTYDHMGRLLSQKQRIGSSPVQLITENSYDELGQLVRKDVGGETALDGYTDMHNMDATTDGTLYHTGVDWNWPSRAKTKGKIDSWDNGGIVFTVPNNDKHVRVGLIKASNASQGNPYFDYGIYTEYDTGTQTNKIKLVLGNSSSTGNYGTYTAGTIFKIQRVDNVIKFYKNGIPFHSVNATSDPLVGKVAFSGPGASVEGLALTGTNIDKKLQKIKYRYNIRGWLTNINNVDPGIMEQQKPLFNFKINYNTLDGNGTPLYNGNIAQTFWKTDSQDKNVRGYTYEYDPLNRIMSANSYEGTNLNGMAMNTEYKVNAITYDKNGNILTLSRYGADDNVVPSFGKWDDLTYTYDGGNKLMKVVDNSTSGSHRNFGFKDGTNPRDDYRYDENGNMTQDLNKDIYQISYNHLNLPVEIRFDLANSIPRINYVYDATGTKLSKTVVDEGTIKTEYAGNFIYNNAGGSQMTLQFFNHPEGYVEPVMGEESVKGFEVGLPGPTYSSYKYVFQYKDHLGNVRLSYSDLDLNGAIDPSTEILEEHNYYPFGLEHKGYNNVVNGTENNYFNFNGKELDESLGLNWHDFGARNYDASLGRWMNIDPMAELPQNITLSPYNYVKNNPIKFVDPDGMIWKDQQEADDLKDDIRKTQAGLRKDIARIQGKISSQKNMSAKEKARKQKRIKNMKTRIGRMDDSIKDIDALGADQNHTFDLVSGGDLNYVKKGSDGVINIQGPNNALQIHEIKHVALALGSGNGLQFSSKNLLKPALSTNGMQDEIQAYEAQWGYSPSSLPGSVSDGGNVNWTTLAHLQDDEGNYVYPALYLRYSNWKKQEKINKKQAKKRKKNGN